MKINIKESFTSVFEEQGWINKFILGILFITAFPLIDVGSIEFGLHIQKSSTEMIYTKLGLGVISAILILKVFACLMYLVLIGYTIKYAHNKVHDIKPALPPWGNYIKQGFFGILISIFYILIVLIPVVALHLNGFSEHIMPYSLLFLLIPFMFFSMILYSKDLNINDAFDFKNILSIFKRVIKPSYLYALLVLPFAFWQFSYDIIKILPISIILKIPLVLAFGFVDFWLTLVGINIFVQIYKLSEDRKSKKEQI